MISFSQESAILLVVLCTFLWGSWFQTIKRIDGYPLAAYMLWIYGISVVIVWGAIFSLKDCMLQAPIFQQISASWEKTAIAVICGGLAAVGMQNKMWVVERLGMILASSISSTFGIIVGTIYSIIIGGLPANSSVRAILSASAVLLFATILCQLSGVMRDKDLLKKNEQSLSIREMLLKRRKVLILAIANIAFLSTAYPIGLSACVRTVSNPDGFDSLVCIGLMSFGAFIGTAIYSITILVRKKQLNMLFKPGKRILIMALLSAIGHYGGNVINAIASPSLSVAISWPMSNAFPIWSYSWGLVYGEYKGAKKKTYLVLFVGIVLYIVGLLLFSQSIH